MEFLNPGALWLLLLAAIPAVLYLVRRRSRMVRVSTLVFFKTLAQEHQESAWLRRLKRWLSFLLTLSLLVLAVLVLARFVVPVDPGEQPRTVVVMVDRSAFMALVDGDGRNRLEEAKRIVRERLQKVPEEVGVALVAYDIRPEVVQARTTKRRELLSRLDTLVVRPIEGRPEEAFETARMMAGLELPAAIWHLSDTPFTGEFGDLRIHQKNLALPGVSNFGITAVQVRPVPLEHARFDIFVRVALNAAAPGPAKTRLDLSVGGIPSQLREIELAPGGESAFTLRVDGARDQVLRLALAGEDDAFPLDDVVSLPLPEIRPLLAAWIRPDETEDPYTRLALSSIQESGRFELLKGAPTAWPLSEEVDAVIFDGWLPSDWTPDIPAVLIHPPDLSAPFVSRRLPAPVPSDEVRVGNPMHPVLFRVSSSRAAITQTSTLPGDSPLEPLWFAGADPVLSAGEIGGNRVVVMGFSPGMSERLPLTASFPLLMGNALYWCVEPKKDSGANRLWRTGDLVEIGGNTLTWTPGYPRGGLQRVPVSSRFVEMDRVGIWESDSGEKGAAQLLSALESNLPGADPSALAGEDYFAVEGTFASNLKLWLLSAVVGILLLESWLFHRRAVY